MVKISRFEKMPEFEGKNYPLRTGMVIKFKKPNWIPTTKTSKSRFKQKGFKEITGKIIHDSYGDQTNQHTFTILADDGTKHFIKGRHLYETAEILDLGEYELKNCPADRR